jgi:hypothetical protein
MVWRRTISQIRTLASDTYKTGTSDVWRRQEGEQLYKAD